MTKSTGKRKLMIAKALWLVAGYIIATCDTLASPPIPRVKIDQSLVKCTVTSNFGSAIQTVNLKVEAVIHGDKTLAGSKLRTWLPIGTLNSLRANPDLVCVVFRDRNKAMVVREVWCPPYVTASDDNPDLNSPKAPSSGSCTGLNLFGDSERADEEAVPADQSDSPRRGGYEDIYRAIGKKHGESLICAFDYFDMARNWYIRLYVNRELDKCLVVFHGPDVKVKCSVGGVAASKSDVFTPEKLPWEIHKADLHVHPVVEDVEVGHWFRKDASRSVQIEVSSKDGCFQIEWDPLEKFPRVSVCEHAKETGDTAPSGNANPAPRQPPPKSSSAPR